MFKMSPALDYSLYLYNRIRRLIHLILISAIISAGCSNSRSSRQHEIIIFHAGSLSVPFKKLAGEFEKRNPGTKILSEAAGSLVCARKITELKKPCDIIASADYIVINELLIPEYASWGIRFATNEMVIAFNEKSKYGDQIDSTNWMDILLKPEVTYSRSDPDADPGGYRTVLAFKLSEKYYCRPGLTNLLTAKNREFIRPKEVDLIALMESHAVDYMFQYKSVAIQHDLKYITLPDEINLGNPYLNDLYQTVSIDVVANEPGSTMTIIGEYINYSLTVPDNAVNKDLATDFIAFLLSEAGMEIFRECGQEPIIPFSTEQPELIPGKLTKYLKTELL